MRAQKTNRERQDRKDGLLPGYSPFLLPRKSPSNPQFKLQSQRDIFRLNSVERGISWLGLSGEVKVERSTLGNRH